MRADLVLCPNRACGFRSALSGVYGEAIACAKPIVIASGSLRAERIAPYGSSVVFDDGSSGSLAKAIRHASEHLSGLTESARPDG